MIKIFSPLKEGKITGNHVTANRYALHLQKLGYSTEICSTSQKKLGVEKIDCAFVLHAEKGRQIVKKMTANRVPVVLILTGTDLYRDIKSQNRCIRDNCLESIRSASAIIVLHKNAVFDLLKIISIPRERIFVILQSVESFVRRKIFFEVKKSYRILILGNIRQEKGIEVAISGFLDFHKSIDDKHEFSLEHIGDILDQSYFRKIKNDLEEVRDIKFLGAMERERLRSVFASYDLLLHSSFIEGGSLVIQEAQNAGVPIIASDISCHISLLGADYIGLHTCGSKKDVTKKLQAFFFDKFFRKNMELQLSRCSAASATVTAERNGLSRVLSYIQT